jgi:hypothetical protein
VCGCGSDDFDVAVPATMRARIRGDQLTRIEVEVGDGVHPTVRCRFCGTFLDIDHRVHGPHAERPGQREAMVAIVEAATGWAESIPKVTLRPHAQVAQRYRVP